MESLVPGPGEEEPLPLLNEPPSPVNEGNSNKRVRDNPTTASLENTETNQGLKAPKIYDGDRRADHKLGIFRRVTERRF